MILRKQISFIYFTILIVLLLISFVKAQQNNPMDNTRWNKMDINKVATVFNNAGMLCDGNHQNYNNARSPSFEYPQGSNKEYGTCVAVVVGAPFPQDPAVVGGVNLKIFHILMEQWMKDLPISGMRNILPHILNS